MQGRPMKPRQDDPTAPMPFRFLAVGTFTSGKSFWLTPAISTSCEPEPKHEPEEPFRRGPNGPAVPRRQAGDF